MVQKQETEKYSSWNTHILRAGIRQYHCATLSVICCYQTNITSTSKIMKIKYRPEHQWHQKFIETVVIHKNSTF